MNRSPLSRDDSVTNEGDPRILRRLSQFVSCSGALAILLGLWVLTGWMLHLGWMKRILPGQVAVKANAAACFALIGLALWVLRKEDSRTASVWKIAVKVGAVTGGVVGLLSFVEYASGWYLGIDQLLFKAGAEDIPGSVRPGLMSPLAGLSFLGLAITLLMLDFRSGVARWSSQLLSCAVAIAAMFGILDFVLDPVTTHTHISPVTAVVLFLFSFGVMFARTQWGLGALVAGDTQGAVLTRRLLPAAILIPLAIGWLRWEGQSTGLYSDWTGVALMTVISIVLLSGLTVLTGITVSRSERKRRVGQETLNRLASIVECSSDAIIGKTIDGIVTSWNPGAEAIYGYSAQEIVGHPVSIVIPPDRRDEYETILEKIRHGQRISQYETERLRKDGQIVSVSLSVSPVKDKAGNLVGVSTITRDITERKRTEAALQESEARFRSLSDLVPQFVWMCTPEGLNVYFNQRWVEYTGLSLEESYGRGWNTPFHPDDKQAAWDAWNHAVATGDTYRVESRLRARDGRYRWFLMRGVPLRDASGSIVKWFGTCTDIDDLKQAEEALRRASLYSRSLLEASLDPLVTISRDGMITDVNQATEKITGISRQQLIGSDYSNYFTEPESARRGYKRVFEEGTVQNYPLAIRNTVGKVTDVLYNASLFRNEAGEVMGVFAAARDITERKRAERALRTLSACNESLVRATDEQTLLRSVCDLAVNVGGYRMAWVGYAEHDARKTVQPVAESGVEAGYLDAVNITWADEERGRGPTGTAIRTGTVAVCHDVTTDPYFAPWREDALRRDYHSSLVLPLKSREEVLGAISIYANEAGAFDAAEQHLLEELANNLSYGIVALRASVERKRGEEEIRKLNHALEERVQQRTAQLHESERRVRRKLESILSPEGNLGHLELGDFLDIPAVQSLAEDFYKLAKIPMFILDLEGHPLIAAGWQEVCTKFHRANADACKNCRESDRELSSGVKPGEFKLYKCKNNLWDVVTPITVGGEHVGNLFSGQFFFTDETIDYPQFRLQARKYGFDEQAYIAAVNRVPRLSRSEVETGMTFYVKLAQLLSQISYSSIKLARSMTETSRVNNELAASVKELEAFTYSVSHDLRAPLRHISGFSKILTDEFGSNLPPAAQHHLQRIQEGTRRMGLLVDDLLNLARVGRRDLSFQTASLKSITNEVITDLGPECVDRQIEWKIGTLPFVECDPALMKQVFQNLLSNAVKFTRPRSQAVIEVGQKDEDGSAVVFVRDNGVGFNMKYSDKLFGVFQRLHRPEDFEGTGVGLATVQRIIQKHGGRIWAEAELDKGATFCFTLGTSEKTKLKTNAAMSGDKS